MARSYIKILCQQENLWSKKEGDDDSPFLAICYLLNVSPYRLPTTTITPALAPALISSTTTTTNPTSIVFSTHWYNRCLHTMSECVSLAYVRSTCISLRTRLRLQSSLQEE